MTRHLPWTTARTKAAWTYDARPCLTARAERTPVSSGTEGLFAFPEFVRVRRLASTEAPTRPPPPEPVTTRVRLGHAALSKEQQGGKRR